MTDTPSPLIEKQARYYGLIERAAFGPKSACQLKNETRDRKDGYCKVCTCKRHEFEFDNVLSQLIADGVFTHFAICPFHLFAGMLLATLHSGPEAQFVLFQKKQFAIDQLNKASKCIAAALNYFNREDIEISKEEFSLYARLHDLAQCEPIISAASDTIKAGHKQSKARGGRPTRLDAEGITECCLPVWQMLAGDEPVGSHNVRLHDLLSATWTTAYGSQKPEPNWEHQIKKAQKRKG
jgi:hypothetical protein